MIRARVHQGRVEIQEPLPEEWEGRFVKILPLTPDDPLPDLEERLAALESLGPTEYEPGEREIAARLLAELDSRTDEEWVAADEAAAAEGGDQAVVTVPAARLPEIRRLLASHKAT
jgi:hypothetical protein